MTQPLAVVIEDEVFLADIFATTLEEAGYKVHQIHHGRQALAWLKENTPALIVLDLHLPGVMGSDIFSFVRLTERLRTVWVMIATADAAMADYLQSRDDPYLLTLLKPISPSQLEELAKRLQRTVE
jgi:DNA-binding response OmpR family regulator